MGHHYLGFPCFEVHEVQLLVNLFGFEGQELFFMISSDNIEL